jgi:thymidylate synthase (FAD)
MQVTLLSHTKDIDSLIATAARTCYSAQTTEDIFEDMQYENNKKKNAEFVQKLRDMGHESPLEHVSFTFGIDGVSRSLTHQLVRHRVASYSQQSQRYVTGTKFNFVTPHSIQKNPSLQLAYSKFLMQSMEMYEALTANGIPKEDARYLLPNATTTNIVVTMNVRELLHFFSVRCCTRAQWEIRELAWKMLEICKKVSPTLFNGCGAFCDQHKYCKEGSMSCGRYPVLASLLNSKEEEKHV